MNIIVQGDKNIRSILSRNYCSDVCYQYSRFLICQDVAEGKLLLNTITGEVILLSPEEYSGVYSASEKYKGLITELVGYGFLVPEGIEEDKNVEQLRKVLRIRRNQRKIINFYNILPTTACNARCFYCFEYGIKQKSMTVETADKVIDFIAEHHGDSGVTLAWFGGEPSLGARWIDYICSRMDELDIRYTSQMVSNAYLFDQDMVRHAKESWKLKAIQITLDGTEEVYNRVKAYVGNPGNAYERVIRNIQYFLDEKIKVNIRLNMDNHNADNLSELIDELTERFHGQRYLSIYIRQLKENAGESPINHDENDKARLKQSYNALQGKLENSGWAQIWKFSMPKIRLYTCMADDPYSVLITPDGILSKCEDYIYEHVIGSLDKGITDNDVAEWWRERVQYKKCEYCPLYPSCTQLLKHCPNRSNECDEYDRQRRIKLCGMHMLKAYEKWKEEGETPEINKGGLQNEIPDQNSGQDC